MRQLFSDERWVSNFEDARKAPKAAPLVMVQTEISDHLNRKLTRFCLKGLSVGAVDSRRGANRFATSTQSQVDLIVGGGPIELAALLTSIFCVTHYFLKDFGERLLGLVWQTNRPCWVEIRKPAGV